MAVRIKCPECRARLRFPDSIVGSEVQCHYCFAAFLLEEDMQLEPKKRSQEASDGKNRPDDAEPKKEPREASKGRNRPDDAMNVIGLLAMIFGFLVVAFFWLIFKTVEPFQHVHNFGLLNDRIVGTVVGVGLAIVGAILYRR